MKKVFFTKVSPKAVNGIRRAYAASATDVSAMIDPTSGSATVVVTLPNDRPVHTRRRIAA